MVLINIYCLYLKVQFASHWLLAVSSNTYYYRTVFIRRVSFLFLTTDNLVEKINPLAANSLEIINRIFNSHLKCMLPNFSITNFIWFHANRSRNVPSPLIKIANKVTQGAGSTTFLVLTIDYCLSWDAHVNNLSNKFNSGVYSLRRILLPEYVVWRN